MHLFLYYCVLHEGVLMGREVCSYTDVCREVNDDIVIVVCMYVFSHGFVCAG